MRIKSKVFGACILLICTTACARKGAAQQPVMSGDDRMLIEVMLRAARDDVKRDYYDPKIRGLDWDGLYAKWQAKIPTARNLGEGMRIVSAYLSELKDTHTFLLPPMRSVRMDYGYQLEEIGDKCFVTQVRPDSDAEAKLHIGDQVLKLDGYLVTREDFHALQRYRMTQAMLNGSVMTIRTPTGDERELRVRAAEHPVNLNGTTDNWGERMRNWESDSDSVRKEVVTSGDVAIWKLPEFNLDEEWIQTQMDKARRHKALILDLRGNPGGAITTLSWLAGSFFDHDVKIADKVQRTATKPMMTRHASHAFDGKLIVLVDARSASCSELLSRLVQLEHRGTVIGDRSAGAVMESIQDRGSVGPTSGAVFAFSITEANLIMTDGKSLEGAGVTPDEQMLPTAADLVAGRDPVLAHAVELAGGKMDPAEAGKLFPYEWPKFK
jgi:carboxyl-terminal processing protease